MNVSVKGAESVKGSRWRSPRLPIVLGILLALYAVAGFWLVPRLMRSAIVNYVEEDLKRVVEIGRITFNPFTLASTIEQFALKEADHTPIASFDALRVNFQISSIFYRAWTFREVRLEAPDINVVIDGDGTLNLAKLQPDSSPSPDPSAPTELPRVRIGTLAVSDGRIGFEDRSAGRQTPFTATLAPIRFTLNDFRTTKNYQNGYSFEGSTTAGERLAWSGQFSVDPAGSTGQFTINDLHAATIAAYLEDSLTFALPSGLVDLEGSYRLALPDRVELNIDLPTLQVRDLAIAPKVTDEPEPWIQLPAVNLTNVALSYHDRSVRVDRVQVDEASARIWRDAAGNINLQSLLGENSEVAAAPVETDTQTGAAGSGPEWSVNVGEVALRDAAIDMEDRMVRPAVRWVVKPATVTVTNVSNRPGEVLQAMLDLTIDEDGRVSGNGDLTLTPMSSNLEIDVAGFPLAPLQPYITPVAAIELTSGRLSAKGTFNLKEGPDATPQMKFAGDISIASLATRESASQQHLISWDEVRLAGVTYSDAPASLDIDRIVARRPVSRVIISEEGTLNITAAMRRETPPPEASATGGRAASPMPMRIGAVVIENGVSEFSDFSVEPNFSATIFDLNGGVSGLTSDLKSRAEVKLSGNVDRYAPVEISGQLNLLSAAVYSDINMTFRNMELTTFNPYSGKYAGYSIRKGKLTTELQYKIENRMLDAKHHVVLDQLEFGDATDSKSKVPLPIRLAAALLKDRRGVIDIDVPVTGSLDDPEFRIGPLIWKAFLGLLTKAVTAPFSLLGSLFGGGDEIAFVDFAPGSAELAPDQEEKLGSLANALVERPELRLDIPLQTVIDLDDEAMARNALDAAIAKFLPAPDQAVPPTREQRMAALAQLYEQTLGAPPAYPAVAADADAVGANLTFLENALRARYAPTPEQRVQLARARASAVQNAILRNTGVAPERVFLAERESGETKIPGTVRMEFRLD